MDGNDIFSTQSLGSGVHRRLMNLFHCILADAATENQEMSEHFMSPEMSSAAAGDQ